MRTVVLLLLAPSLLAIALAAPAETQVLNNGALCMLSIHCKSSCCHRASAISLARCAPKASETEKCSAKSIYGSYYHCPCEHGLKCDTDWTIGGAITNTNFGVCKDPSTPKPPTPPLQTPPRS
ncbi:colipase-like [Alosa pseudoharengus]|uniref:colipase-like n=1 Tax=Alosa pseudoharengus TaxID=34774 RepID=UPI003F89A06A